MGITCDFYIDENDNTYMSRTQIGYALGYKEPSNAVLRIHQRHYERLDKMSVNVEGCQFVTPYINKDKNAHIYMYSEKGIYEICRHSKQALADRFYDWVYEVISSIKNSGHYIASEKDAKWLATRELTKQTRRMETDTIKKFVEYAKTCGSANADRYYQNFTTLVHKRLGIESGGRDNTEQKTLLRLKSLETLIDMRLESLMKTNIPYKDMYLDVKQMIENI